MDQDFKERLLRHCIDSISIRLDELSDSLKGLQKAANEETKSTAGDKYETGRAMAMLEKEKFAARYQEAEKQLRTLRQIRLTKNHLVQTGSLVKANDIWYFIAASLGKVQFEAEDIYVISAVAPLAQALLGMRESDTSNWRGKPLTIQRII